jgi:hypothetical protein
MGFLSEFVPNESLRKWREPNAYVRKGLSHFRWIGLVIVLLIAPLGLTVSFWSNHNFNKGIIILISIFIAIEILGFIRIWFCSGDVVRLKEDSIMKTPGRCPYESLYKNIESCNVCHDSYNNTKFSVLKFTLKKPRNYLSTLPTGQIKEVAVPDDVDLEQILKILRDKGVKVVKQPLTS